MCILKIGYLVTCLEFLNISWSLLSCWYKEKMYSSCLDLRPKSLWEMTECIFYISISSPVRPDLITKIVWNDSANNGTLRWDEFIPHYVSHINCIFGWSPFYAALQWIPCTTILWVAEVWSFLFNDARKGFSFSSIFRASRSSCVTLCRLWAGAWG